MKKKKSVVILPSKGRKKKSSKKPKRRSGARKNMNLYSSLSYNYRAKKEASSRKHAEELAKLPKEPVKRFFARLHPKRVFKWLFSWQGQKTKFVLMKCQSMKQ